MGRILNELASSTSRRSKSARRLALHVLENPAAVIDKPIGVLAREVGVSEPTVNRFCTALGLKGYPDFKLQLARELARRDIRIAPDISTQDSSSSVIAKIFDAAHACLQETHAGLDPQRVEQAVAVLDAARCIVLCGLGASAPVALDAQHKLMRFKVPVIAHRDHLNQRMAAAGMGAADCMLCISYSGRTRAIIEVAALAQESGASVIGITTAGSALAAHCDLVLPVNSAEDTDVYTPMTSRLGQLAVIDVLTTALATRQGEEFTAHLQRVKGALAATREAK